jgi:hypothetical protein
MATRSGTKYTPTMEGEQGEEGAGELAATTTGAAPLADLVRRTVSGETRN